MSNGIEIEVVSRIPASSTSRSPQIEAVSDEEERELLLDTEKQEEREPLLDAEKQEERGPLQEDWESPQLKPRHTIFLSHSGAQKNFVEQLCVDLEAARQAPFFDKRPDSLPKGEKFAQHIFQAARQCRLAIVVVSDEYFSRSKWPMLELAAFVEASKPSTSTSPQARRCCTILPLFLGLSCKEYGDAERRQRWFERWHEWAQQDPRIHVDVWKEALQELDGRNGMEFVAAFGEVEYRKEVVSTVSVILQKSLAAELVLPSWMSSSLKVAIRLLCYVCFYSIIFFFFFRAFKAASLSIRNFAEDNMSSQVGFRKPTCNIGGKSAPCPDQLLDALNYTGPR